MGWRKGCTYKKDRGREIERYRYREREGERFTIRETEIEREEE